MSSMYGHMPFMDYDLHERISELMGRYAAVGLSGRQYDRLCRMVNRMARQMGEAKVIVWEHYLEEAQLDNAAREQREGSVA